MISSGGLTAAAKLSVQLTSVTLSLAVEELLVIVFQVSKALSHLRCLRQSMNLVRFVEPYKFHFTCLTCESTEFEVIFVLPRYDHSFYTTP